VYFTVLDRFTRAQLEAQRAALQGLEDRLKRAPLTKRMQRQQAALCGRLGSEGVAVVRLSNGVGGGELIGAGVDEMCEVVEGGGVEAAVGVTSGAGVVGAARESKNARGKNQRSSLRKQRLRVEDRLRRLAQGQEEGQGQGQGQDEGQGQTQGQEPDRESRQEPGQGQGHEQGGGIEAAVKERGNVPPLVPSSDPLSNPKTRLGWGFWRN
jgi:hypothetical protein